MLRAEQNASLSGCQPPTPNLAASRFGQLAPPACRHLILAISLIVTWLPIFSRAEDPLPSAVRQIQGPLRVHPINGRYFTDDSGRVIYLAGSQTGGSDMQEDAWPGWQAPGVRVPSDFPRCLEILSQHKHNVGRMRRVKYWRCEKGKQGRLEKEREDLGTGQGKAVDGKRNLELEE